MKNIKLVVAFLAASLIFVVVSLSGCVGASISSEASRVQVHAQMSNLLADCKKLGPVIAEASDIDGLTSSAATVAEVKLRQAAYDQYSADTVAIINTDYVAMGVRLQGIAYKCY